MDEPSPAFREYWVEAGNLRLRAHVWNDEMEARPLVFLNGAGTNLELAHGFAACFPHRRFIAVEMPGSGTTPVSDTPVPVPLLARLTVQALEQLRAPHFDLIGFSLGGALAQQIAIQYRSQLGSLVLAGTCSGSTMVPHDWSAQSLLQAWFPFAAVWDDLRRDLFGAHLAQAKQASPHALAGQLAAYAGWTSLPLLPFIRARTLVLAGAQDRIIPPGNAQQLAAFIPQADHHVMANAGHFFPFTAPERTAARIRRFLGEPVASGATPAAA
jgi:pimeloyl-ACP methyl ester carboxylesterase